MVRGADFVWESWGSLATNLDSIVRGTTSKEIVQMAKDVGAKKVVVASCAPPIRFVPFLLWLPQVTRVHKHALYQGTAMFMELICPQGRS